jgi:hypothetical protein
MLLERLLPTRQTFVLLLISQGHAFTISSHHCGAVQRMPSEMSQQIDESQPSIYELVRKVNSRQTGMMAEPSSIIDDTRKLETLSSGNHQSATGGSQSRIFVPSVVVNDAMPTSSQPHPNEEPNKPVVATSDPDSTQRVHVSSGPISATEPPQPVAEIPDLPAPVPTPPRTIAVAPAQPEPAPIVTPPTQPSGPRCRTAAFVDASFTRRHQDKGVRDFVTGIIRDSSDQFIDQFGFGFDLVQIYENAAWGAVSSQNTIRGVNNDISRFLGAEEYCAIILFTGEVLDGVCYQEIDHRAR